MGTKRCFDNFREPNITRAKYGPSQQETSFQSSLGIRIKMIQKFLKIHLLPQDLPQFDVHIMQVGHK